MHEFDISDGFKPITYKLNWNVYINLLCFEYVSTYINLLI